MSLNQHSTNCHSLNRRVTVFHAPLTEIRVWEKNLSVRVTSDSDSFFHEESIGEGFKIVTVAVFEKILLFPKKNGVSLMAILKSSNQ